jgi:hypothetical protein
LKKSVTAVVFLLVFLGIILLVVFDRFPLDLYAVSLAAVTATVIDVALFIMVRVTGSSRISLALSGDQYILGKFVNDSLDIENKNIREKDIKNLGAKRVWQMDKDNAYEMPERFYHASRQPVAYWKKNDPIPIELKPWRADSIIGSTTELSDAVNSKAISDLNKSIYTRVELLLFVGVIVAVGIGVLNLYLINSVSDQFNNLINQLNRIVGALPK